MAAAAEAIPGRSLWADAWLTLRRNRAAVASGLIIIAMAVLVIVGPWLSPYSYDFTDWSMVSAAPDFQSGHVFGTDALGRDLLVRTLYGGRISLLVGVVATAVSLLIVGSLRSSVGVVAFDHAPHQLAQKQQDSRSLTRRELALREVAKVVRVVDRAEQRETWVGGHRRAVRS